MIDNPISDTSTAVRRAQKRQSTQNHLKSPNRALGGMQIRLKLITRRSEVPLHSSGQANPLPAT
jgi:hypothetical protein